MTIHITEETFPRAAGAPCREEIAAMTDVAALSEIHRRAWAQHDLITQLRAMYRLGELRGTNRATFPIAPKISDDDFDVAMEAEAHGVTVYELLNGAPQ